ncbi:MAG: TerB family tellurite resistance protein [Gemmataceae bacterium]|nr:TerB family tellurite resistance protein [Gemmataceae bacterium]
MADWKKLAKAALLADGRIDTKEVEIIRKALLADGRIDKAELEFLADLRQSATSAVRAFTELFLRAIKSRMLEDGVISDPEAKWLRKTIFADKNVDADEVQLLKDLKHEAKHCGPEFQKLYDECIKA